MRFGPKPIGLLTTLSPSQAAELRTAGSLDTYRKNAVIYRPGAEARSIYLVTRGRVRLRDRDRDGELVTVGFAALSEIFGLEPLAGIETRSLTAVAAESTELLSVRVARLRDLLQRDRSLATLLLQHLAAAEMHARERAKALAFLDVPSRLAGMVVWLADRYGVETEGGREIPYWFTHQELAELIGSTRETVTTVLADFRREGLMAVRDHRFLVRDRERLVARIGIPGFGRSDA